MHAFKHLALLRLIGEGEARQAAYNPYNGGSGDAHVRERGDVLV